MVLLACACAPPPPGAGAPDSGGAPLCEPEHPALLYVTHSAGFRHAVLPHSVEVLREVASSVGLSVRHGEDARDALQPGRYESCRAVVFFTSGELPLTETQKEAFLAWVRGGGTFLGFHSATDTFYEWPAYGAMVGAYFDGHPWHQTVTIDVVQAGHPIVAALAPLFRLNDEIYQFRDLVPDASVLLRLDESSVDLGANGVRERPWRFPLAWVRSEGAGRVFYTALGHGSAWDDPSFRTLVQGALAWAAASAP